MSEQTIIVTLPDSVYDRVRKTAQSTSLSLEEVIKQSIVLLLPAFESEIPPEALSNMARLSLLNDIQLWKMANSKMDEFGQMRLEELAELNKRRLLTDNEKSELDTLMDEARQIMLLKAEARRILAQRGHVVFQSNEH